MTDIASPYRGLTPYTEADADYFFGRTQGSANLAANLEVARLTIFYGPSGVGKSSVLRAGVIHTLQQRAKENLIAGGRPEITPVYFNRWQGEPLQGLSQAIITAVQPFLLRQDTSETTIDDLRLTNLLATLSSQTDSELLLVLDQFEEYFLYHPDERGPWTFAYELVQAVNNAGLRANFLLSLREDALGQLDHFKGQIPFLWDNRLSIEHLSRAAGWEAVTQPLEQYNVEYGTYYTIEPELVEAVLDQVGRGKLALSKQGTSVSEAERGRIEAPYLQLVLTRLWEQEQVEGSILLRQDTLKTLGGAESIVSNYLNDTMAGLPNADQAVASHLFDRLVTLSGAKIALTLVELAYYADADLATVQPLVQQLEQRRLLRSVQAPTGVTQYEIFHDVLGQALLEWQQRYQTTQAAAERLAAERAAHAEAERRAYEIQLSVLNETLEQRVAERTADLKRSNQELDQFAYIAAHDLKAPLRAIDHLARWIMDDAYDVLPEPSKVNLAKLRERIKRMEKLTDDLLAYSRAGRTVYTPEVVETAALVKEIAKGLAIPPSFTIRVEEPMPVVYTVREPLSVVLRNLIGNAIKHHNNQADGLVQITAQDQGDQIEFSVVDNGPGIASEFHRRIFQMFQTVRPRDQVEGSGTGLAIAKKIVESYGGSIQIESTEGQGATFHFTWRKTH